MKTLLLVGALLAAPFIGGCNPCTSDQACGSEGLCFQGSCHDFSADQIPCACTTAADCKISGLSCAGGKCVTDLGTPVMCKP